jgi:hypothetical protein
MESTISKYINQIGRLRLLHDDGKITLSRDEESYLIQLELMIGVPTKKELEKLDEIYFKHLQNEEQGEVFHFPSQFVSVNRVITSLSNCSWATLDPTVRNLDYWQLKLKDYKRVHQIFLSLCNQTKKLSLIHRQILIWMEMNIQVIEAKIQHLTEPPCKS